MNSKNWPPNQYVVREGFIQRATPAIPRSGEGAAVAARDGTVILAYTRFIGGADEDDGSIVMTRTADSGANWSTPTVIREKSGPRSLNVMSASLLRLASGAIAFAYLEKTAPGRCLPFMCLSHDEGESWTEPRRICPENNAYYSINNDRLGQSDDGRLFLPFNEYHFASDGKRDNGACGVFFSDDEGRGWRKSASVRLERGTVAPPPNFTPEKSEMWERVLRDGVQNQEPGVIQRVDGSLMMWVRTRGGYMYSCRSEDKGETWGTLTAVRSLVCPLSPQTIKRIPGTSRLVCFYNNHAAYAFGEEPWWNWRTPLTVAVSDDEGESWRVLGNLEDESHNACYVSALFVDEKVFLTYYLSENSVKDGVEIRRNLASLKFKVVETRAFFN